MKAEGLMTESRQHAPVMCTIVAKNYLAHARTLVDSFLEQHPEGRAFVLLADRPDGFFDPGTERFATVLAEELGIPDFQAMLLRYTVLELSTAVKPFFLEHLFQQYDLQRLCYFDPDIFFYQPIDKIWAALETYAIVLIPHLLGPLDDGFNPNELTILRSGAYNLGFLGLSRHPETDHLLKWWQDKMHRYCVVAFDQGLFVDQRWMDLVPARYASTCIHRDPGCDVAYWNLYNRVIDLDGDPYTVNGVPLKFYHFSGFSPDRPDLLSKHQNRYTFQDRPELRPLFQDYAQRLRGNGFDAVKNWPYSYDGVATMGVRMPDIARALWRELEINDPSWSPCGLGLDQPFAHNLLAWLNEPMGETKAGLPPVTRLALALYQRRPDLQRAFPDVMGRDRVQYVRWFVNYARDELEIDEFFVAPMAEPLSRLTGSQELLAQQGLRAWAYQSFTQFLFRIGVGKLIERSLGEQIVGPVRRFFLQRGPIVPSAPTSVPALVAPLRHPGSAGVNLVGYLTDETGVGESARATLRALHGQGFPVAWTMVKSHHARQNDRSALDLPQGNPYDINLFYVNADQMNVVHEELGSDFFSGKYNIGYWAWELDRFPPEWKDRIDRLDEIWVGSRFVQNTLAHIARIPVLIMGVGTDRRAATGITRERLSLPDDRFLLLFVFDMLSFIERKNPYDLIEAYRQAFGPHFADTILVIKVTNLDRYPEHTERLRRAVASVSGILMDRYLDRTELDGLFKCCDAYVSLHRSEGFGMTLAEAMRMGKPVIATDYSGNTDFMTISNSYPVQCDLVELQEDHGPYKKGGVWAQPDLEHAAAQMRCVFENCQDALKKGQRAAADIERWYGREAMARKIVERLQVITATRG
jgi:glycosyltransferase involved in cell wall biosynthesis